MKTSFIKWIFILVLVPMSAHCVNSCEALFGTPNKSKTDVSRKYTEGLNEDHLFREGSVAAHIYINNKEQKPYMFFALPEGNTGFGLWFNSSARGAKLHSVISPQAVIREGMHGVQIEIGAGTPHLDLEKSILSSMRFVRDQELDAPVPDRVLKQTMKSDGKTLTVDRQSFNREVRYQIKLEVLGDTQISIEGDIVRLDSPSEVRFRITVLTDERLLTPMNLEDLFEASFLKTIRQEERDLISFLIYKEKLMAGSPRYQTKFGRDTLISLRVFMKYMKPEGLETLIIASLSSANPKTGQTSHEQHEGEITSWERIKRHKKMVGVTEPIEDYAMVDDDFMLAYLTASHMKMHPQRAKDFLEKKDARGLPVRDLVQKNYEYVFKNTRAFALNPIFQNLIRLKPGHTTGQWRDSEIGLGGGVYPFDVNAAIVPGTLQVLSEVYGDHQNEFYDAGMARTLQEMTQVWSNNVLPLYMVKVSAPQVREAAASFMKVLGFDINQMPPGPHEDIIFPAISLREDGSPVKIMHTDDSMMGTYGHPPVEYLQNMTKLLSTPFPYGLHTDAGLVVANAVFENVDLQKRFTPKNYHGLVSWGREENLLIFGITRQMTRSDVPADLRASLLNLRKDIGKLVQKKGGIELIAIVQRDGKMVAEPFAGDALPNIDQFWNHLFVVSRQLLLNQ
jgi:hypothetical protein